MSSYIRPLKIKTDSCQHLHFLFCSPTLRCNWTTLDALKVQAAICKENLTRSSPTVIHDVIWWNIHPLGQTFAFQGGSLTDQIAKLCHDRAGAPTADWRVWQVARAVSLRAFSKCTAVLQKSLWCNCCSSQQFWQAIVILWPHPGGIKIKSWCGK